MTLAADRSKSEIISRGQFATEKTAIPVKAEFEFPQMTPEIAAEIPTQVAPPVPNLSRLTITDEQEKPELPPRTVAPLPPPKPPRSSVVPPKPLPVRQD